MYFTWFRPPHIFRQTVAPLIRSKTLGNSLDTGAQQHYELEAQKEVFYVLFFFLSQHSVIDTGDQIRRPTETRFAFTLGILCVLRVLPLFALSSLEGGEGDKHLCDPPSGAIIFRWERSGREKLSLLLSWLSRRVTAAATVVTVCMHAGGERGHKKRKRLLGSGERPIGKRFSSSSVHFAERNEEEQEHKTHVFSLLPSLSLCSSCDEERGRTAEGKKCDSPFPPFFPFFPPSFSSLIALLPPSDHWPLSVFTSPYTSVRPVCLSVRRRRRRHRKIRGTEFDFLLFPSVSFLSLQVQ